MVDTDHYVPLRTFTIIRVFLCDILMDKLPKSKSLMVFLEIARSGGIMNASKNLISPSLYCYQNNQRA